MSIKSQLTRFYLTFVYFTALWINMPPNPGEIYAKWVCKPEFPSEKWQQVPVQLPLPVAPQWKFPLSVKNPLLVICSLAEIPIAFVAPSPRCSLAEIPTAMIVKHVLRLLTLVVTASRCQTIPSTILYHVLMRPHQATLKCGHQTLWHTRNVLIIPLSIIQVNSFSTIAVSTSTRWGITILLLSFW